jgi:hypothetical protein
MQPVTMTSPPVMAAAMRKVPASMRSGMMVCSAPFREETPRMRMVSVPAPSMWLPSFEQIGEVGDFGFAGGVFEDGFAFGHDGGHEEVFGAGDGDAVEVDQGAAEPIWGLGFDIAVRLGNGGAELLQPGHVEVDGARADGACRGVRPWRGRFWPERAEDEAGGTHRFDDVVGSFGVGDIGGGDLDGAIVAGLQPCAVVGEEALHGSDVAHAGDSVERDCLGC